MEKADLSDNKWQELYDEVLPAKKNGPTWSVAVDPVYCMF
jgi:hypothetical protein